jgi:mannose-6-phosphate isomerase
LNGFTPQPYKLYNKIQNYDWGTKNENAFIPKLLGIVAQPDMPYSELWIGAHPKAPSEIEIDGKRISLNDVASAHAKECLGEYTSRKFDRKFPFLLKVLSAARALSIQLHPNKSQAEKLHAKDPKNYPDDNHKPEIAIAVDSLTAIAGFKPVGKIILSVKELPELPELVGNILVKQLLTAKSQIEKERAVKELYVAIMKSSGDKAKLDSCISKMFKRIKTKLSPTEEETQFLIQYELYGNDVGLLSLFFFNMINLKPNQAIFTDAGVPHAYIKGNIIECMANSDNVVRAGLTNKFKDVDTLTEIIKYEFDEYEIINSQAAGDDITYKTTANEFEVSVFSKSAGFKKTITSNDKPSVILITEGTLDVSWKSEGNVKTQKYSHGETVLLPASLSEYNIATIDSAKYFVVEIP